MQKKKEREITRIIKRNIIRKRKKNLKYNEDRKKARKKTK